MLPFNTYYIYSILINSGEAVPRVDASTAPLPAADTGASRATLKPQETLMRQVVKHDETLYVLACFNVF